VKSAADHTTSSNPFSTRFTRPGAVPFQFAPQAGTAKHGLDALVDKLSGLGRRSQIIGPHGSGKSTLLSQLIAVLARRGLQAWLVSLHDGQRRMPSGWVAVAEHAGAWLVIVDGYEQLNACSRLALRFSCRRRGWQLLVTAHQDVGLPTLFHTSTDLATARSIVAQLLTASDQKIDERCIADSFAAAQGNVREMLFELYDRYEQRTRQ